MRQVTMLALAAIGCSCSESETQTAQVDPEDSSRLLRNADDDPLAAKVDGFEIRRSLLEERVQAQVNQFRSAGRPISEAFVQSTRVAMMHHLIDQAVVAHEATRLGLQVSDEQLALSEAGFRDRLASDQAFKGYLVRIGRDLDGWRRDQRQLLRRAQLFAKAAQSKPVNEAAIQARYAQQKSRFAARRRLRLAEILLRTPSAEELADKGARDARRAAAAAKIKRIIKVARRPGAHFARLVKKHSESVSKERGGDLGWRVEEALTPEWKILLAGAKKGAVVGPIDSPDGVRLLKVIAIEEARQARFAEVREELLRELRGRAKAEAERGLVARLRSAATIQILDRRLIDGFNKKNGAK